MPQRTPSQTIGPFFHEALRWKEPGKVAFAKAGGERVVITGRMTDGGGQPVGDAMIETWQALPAGGTPVGDSGSGDPYGFGRLETGKDGSFRIETRMPEGAAPFLDVTIFARGLLKALRTRVYLADEAKLRAEPALKELASSPRLATLLAQRAGNGEYRWDIRLQGEGETVFFAA
ncbi:MAG TPA: protocatechuate 3,4-dioxygenase subunit alpha [Usitatibacter sp.]|nr:protocatechuate 3,4-dioxygenase subunit alpha [Usitatibacter sp.]